MKIVQTKKLIPALIAGIAVLGGVSLIKPASAGDACCEHKKDHQIRVPGFQVSGPAVTVSSTGTKKNTSSLQSASQGFLLQNPQTPQTYLYGGGGGGYIGGGPVPTVITGLTIDGGMQTKTITEQIEVPYSETISSSRWTEKVYVIQAVCMDDTGTPHPASRPDPNEQVNPNYSGELFRCMAGTWMQVSMGEYTGANWTSGQFDNGSTIACQKGESLIHEPGGNVMCRAQAPRRNCNERSLLRKFGPGVKIVRIARQEQFTENVTKTRMETQTRQITVEAEATVSQRTLVLSGGVGGGG